MAQLPPITSEERLELLRAVRITLEEYIKHHRTPVIEAKSPALLQPCGAFVTLHIYRKLRGCIGTFTSSDPLLDTVQRMAIAAATTDSRFPQVQPEELPALQFEISVLSPLSKATPEEIQVGVHGLYITKGYHRGVLLPQVATENGWDRQTFLEHTCLKAGLAPSAWQDPETRIEIFSAEVFGDETSSEINRR